MATDKLFHELLGLGQNWEVVESRFEKDRSTLVLEIRETSALWNQQRCPKDGGRVTCYDHVEMLTWRHLNVFQHACEIQCPLPRGKCGQCGHVYRVRPPWEGLSCHFTKEFEAFALVLMKEMPMSRVAEVVGESDTRLWRMLFSHVNAAYAEADFSNVYCVGVDEMSIRKGHNYVSVFADLVSKRVLFAAEGKDQETWKLFVEALEKHNGHRHAITQASMDMSRSYQAGVKECCRNAEIVFDKFHVIKQANEAVDKVRQAEVRLGGQGVWESLFKSQWIWRKNPLMALTGAYPPPLRSFFFSVLTVHHENSPALPQIPTPIARKLHGNGQAIPRNILIHESLTTTPPTQSNGPFHWPHEIIGNVGTTPPYSCVIVFETIHGKSLPPWLQAMEKGGSVHSRLDWSF